MNTNWKAILFLLLSSIACLYACTSGKESTNNTFQPIQKVPIYKNFNDLEYIFQQQNDTTYVINFWATWCKPCVEELPYFETLLHKNKNAKIKVILVSLDFEKQIESKLIPFINEHQLRSEVKVLLDSKTNVWIDKVDPKWSGAIPVTIVYHNQERHFVEATFDTFEDLNNIVQKFLNQ